MRNDNEGRGDDRRAEQVGDSGGGGNTLVMKRCTVRFLRVHYGKIAT